MASFGRGLQSVLHNWLHSMCLPMGFTAVAEKVTIAEPRSMSTGFIHTRVALQCNWCFHQANDSTG